MKAETIIELADLLSVTPRTISNIISQNGYTKSPEGFYDVATAKDILRKRNENQLANCKINRNIGDKENPDPDGLRSHEIRYKKARADREELKAAREKGTQVDLAEVRKEQVSKEMAFKKSLMNLPKNMATRLMGCGSKEIEAVLTKYVTEAFRKLVQKGRPRMPIRFTGESVRDKKKKGKK